MNKFKKGDIVWCGAFGMGKVDAVNSKDIFVIFLDNPVRRHFHPNGEYVVNCDADHIIKPAPKLHKILYGVENAS